MGDEDGASEDERRRAARVAARVRVRFRSVDELLTTYTTDLSRGGLFVAAAQALPLGTMVELALELPDGLPPASLRARVAYILGPEEAAEKGRAPGMGMQLVSGDAGPVASRIAAFLERSIGAESVAVACPAPERALHVLVVEDSAAYRDQIVAALTKLGHRVTVAEHGLAGLGKAVENPPDIVLSDVHMPVMDGWQMLRLLKARPRTQDVPVMLLTTLDAERERIRAYELGVEDFLAKPFDPHELGLRIHKVSARAREGSGAMRGDIAQVSLASLLAFAEAERRSGALRIRGPQRELEITLAGGAVREVDLGTAGAPADLLERLLIALDVRVGRFELEAGPERPTEGVSIQRALLEHARREDEGGRA